MRLLSIVLLATLAGCASHTGIVSMGDNSYMVAKQQATGFPGLGNMKGELIIESVAFCQSKKLNFELIKATESQPPYILGNYPRAELEFRCK